MSRFQPPNPLLRVFAAPQLDRPVEERWLIVNGQPMFLRTTGMPPAGGAGTPGPIIHVHGFASSGKYMVPTAVALADLCPNVVPDLPGFGRSIDPPATLSIEELADSVALMMTEMGIPRATLLGNSLGTSIISGFATRHPQMISSAVLVSPAGGAHNTPLLRAVAQLGRDAFREPPSLAMVSAPEYMRFGVVEMIHLFAKMTRFPALSHLLQLEVPTLVVAGSRDPVLPPWSRIRKISSEMHTNLDIAVIRGAAHAINFSHPKALAALVTAFLAGELSAGRLDVAGSEVMVLHREGALGSR